MPRPRSGLLRDRRSPAPEAGAPEPVSNGIKYNREHGTVTVWIERTAEGSRIRIDVSDTGRGMPPERLDRLFSPFERLGIEGTGIQGTGLGLALTKPLVEAMGGTIEVSSELGRGSRFSLELASADDAAVAESVRSDDDHPVASAVPGSWSAGRASSSSRRCREAWASRSRATTGRI